MTPEGIAALACLAIAFLAFCGWLVTVWPEYEPNPRLMAHEERRRWR